jgi:response regulator NasT
MLICGDRFVSLSLSAMLQNLGHTAITCSHDATVAVKKMRDLSPDLIIMDESCGLQTAKTILEQHAVPILLITGFIEPSLVDQADAIGITGYVVKPLSQRDIQSALVFARSRFKQLQSLKQEIVELKNTLQSRKLIEQAKGLLMERERIPEAEAFKRIQDMSRNQNISMVALSEAIIMTDKLKNKTAGSRNRFRE